VHDHVNTYKCTCTYTSTHAHIHTHTHHTLAHTHIRIHVHRTYRIIEVVLLASRCRSESVLVYEAMCV
jgi:hypothetical protein